MQHVTTVSTPTGERFELEQPFNRGGEAEIWTICREPHLVAKLYHAPTKTHEAKVMAMLANPPQQPSTHPAAAWPLQLLYQEQRFAGYLMPRVHESRPIFQFYNPVSRARMSESYPWRYFLHRAARNLAAAVDLVHKRGYVIGDLNESNVLVNQSALVTLVDVDSFQVPGGNGLYRSMVGKAEFTPPELHGVDFKTTDRTVAHDHFGLAVLIFYLLMEGYHPFAGVHRGGVSVGRVDLHGIRHGLFPYTRGCEVTPPPHAPNFMWLDPNLRRCFLRAFVTGHTTPDERPSAAEWQETLESAEVALITCRAEPTHIYSSLSVRRCPYCVHGAVPEILPEPPQQATDQPASSVTPEAIAPTAAPSWMQLLTVAHHTGWRSVQGVARQKAQEQLQHGTVASAQWTKEQSLVLWQGAQQQIKALLLAVMLLPRQAQTAQQVLRQHGGVGQRWLIGNAIGSPVGALAAVGGYQLALQGASVPAIVPMMTPFWHASATTDQLFATQLLWIICGLLFGIALGAAQAWALRPKVLRWSYLRSCWVTVSGVAGAMLGALAHGKVTPTMLLQPIWSLEHLSLCALVLLFGGALGLAQSFILRHHLQRADDSRFWTVANAFAWLLVLEGTLVGFNWNGEATAWTAQGITPTLWAEPGFWIGGWLGASIGLLLAGALTGSVLIWMLGGLWRDMYWYQLAMHLLQWRYLPRRLQQRTIQWGRGLLLLVVLVLLLEGVLFLSQ